jgi:hypothetical protein
MKRNFVPRGKESINRQLDSENKEGMRTGTMPGDFSINPSVKVRFDRLRCYNGGKTVIRVWPMLDPERPTEALLNGRQNTMQTAGLSGMSISEPTVCVSYAGIKRESRLLPPGEEPAPFSYIIARSDQQRFVGDGVPYWDEPYIKLYVTCKRAKDSGQFTNGRAWDASWNSLMAGTSPELCAFKKKYFVVCSVYENSDDLNLERERVSYKKNAQLVEKEFPRMGVPLGEGPTDALVVMQLPISAGKKIFQLCNLEKQDWQGDEHRDPSIMFKYGDPTGKFDPATGTVKGGLFFTLYNPTKVTIDKHTTFKGVVPAIVEYEAAVASKYQAPNGAALTADLNEEQVKNVLAKHLFFWKESAQDANDSYLLHEPSIEQRCELIAKGFKHVPKLLEFAWMSHSGYLNFDSVAGILKNRRSTTVVKPDFEPGEEEEDFEQEQPVPAPKPKPKAVVPQKATPVAKSVADLVDDFDDDDVEEVDEDELEDSDGESSGSVKAPVKGGKTKIRPEDDFDDEEDAEEEDFASAKSAKGESSDDADDAFDDEQDSTTISESLNEQLKNSMSKANAIARSRNRSSKPGK